MIRPDLPRQLIVLPSVSFTIRPALTNFTLPHLISHHCSRILPLGETFRKKNTKTISNIREIYIVWVVFIRFFGIFMLRESFCEMVPVVEICMGTFWVFWNISVEHWVRIGGDYDNGGGLLARTRGESNGT